MNEYERKSLELAVRNQMTWGWARFQCSAYGGKELWTVQSKTDSTKRYEVESKAGHVIACGCAAGAWGKPCCHAGAVVQKLAWRQEQLAAERAELPTAGCPSAYSVARLDDGRYYPMRFGKFQLDARGYRISYGERESAVDRCWMLQREYERDTAPMYRSNAGFSLFKQA